MKVSELLEQRRDNWRQLEQLCALMEGRKRAKQPGQAIARFATLYRSACADLALADAYQLPVNTQMYLHQLVARAHNQLYRSRRFDFASWGRVLFRETPRRLLRDKCLWITMALFWGLFFACILLTRSSPEFAERIVGKDALEMYRQMYEHSPDRQNSEESGFMNSFYSLHNTSIGLTCFALGLLFGVGGLPTLIFNAALLGAVYGHMMGTPQWGNFLNFTTAHGPFELTAVVFSAAAGMRLGFSQIDTRGMSRGAALRLALDEAAPTMSAAVVLFLLAALTEGFVSPSGLPYGIKLAVAVISLLMLLFYVVVLGLRQDKPMTPATPAALSPLEDRTPAPAIPATATQRSSDYAA